MTIRLVDLSTLYWMVSTDAPGLNENTAIDWLRWAARRFCMETNCSQDTVESSIAANDPILAVDSPNSTHLLVHRVLSVEAATRPIIIKSMDDLNATGDWRARTGTPMWCTPESPNEMRLVPIPTVAEALITMRVSFVPKLTATKIDGDIADRYGEVIAGGALGQILRISGQTWTNTMEAEFRQRKFDLDCNRARPIGAKNNAFTTTRQPLIRQF